MLRQNLKSKRKLIPDGQTAIEYMLLLTVVAAVTLIAFKVYLPRVYIASNLLYNRSAVGIMGPPNPCGDGNCATFENLINCCVDCGSCSGYD